MKTKRITAQEAKRERLDMLNISAEKLGVGFVYRKSSFKGTEMDVTCIKKRIISLTINSVPLGISLTNVYAPHAGLTSQTKTDGFLWLPSPFSKTTSTKSNQFDIGWFRRKINGNTPWRKSDSWPVIYRDPESAISNLSSGQLENRKMFIDLCLEETFTGEYLVLQTDG